MPNLRDIRRRIRGVRNTQQVTRAMKIVAAAKLRRAQDRIIAARPYANRMMEVLSSLATRANPEDHALLRSRGAQRIELVVLTADKGFCGAFNGNIIKQANHFLGENAPRDVRLHLVGRKGRDYYRRHGGAISAEYADFFRKVEFAQAQRIAADLIRRYIDEELDAVYLLYNEFKSIIQQRVTVEQLLPIRRLGGNAAATQDYIYEPGAAALLDVLLPKHVEIQIMRALLESAAAEFGARMTAMDSATRNAGEMIQNLTLTMNRVRQAAITREIIEIVSGANAL